MADFLIPFLTGATQQYISDEDALLEYVKNYINL